MGLRVDLSRLKLDGRAEVLHRPGAVRLDGYPLLTHAPARGPGIRTEDRGIHVGDIARAYRRTPDAEALARNFGTTRDHIMQAIRYVIEATGAAR